MGNSPAARDGADPRPAVYGDLRRLRRVFTWFVATALAGFAAGFAIVLTHGDVLFAVIIAIGIVPVAASLLLIRRDRLEASAIFLSLTLFAVLTVLATTGLGIHHISNFAFAVVILISSMVTRKRTLIALTIVAVGCVAWLVFGELSGAYTPQPLARSVPGDFFSAAVVIAVTAVLARLLTETLLVNNMHLQRELRERTRAEEALRQKNEELESYFASSLDLLCIATTRGEFVRLNPEWEKVLGYSVADLEGKGFLDFVHPDDREGTRAVIAKLGDQEVVLNFENRYRSKEGGYRWIEWRSRPRGALVYAAARDITDRKRAEEAVRESESRFRAFVEQAPVAIGVFNLQGTGMYANAKFAETLGLGSAEEAIGRTASGYFAPQFREESEERTRRRLEGLPVPAEFESVALRSDGSEFPVHMAVAPIRLADEAASIAFLTDITERKRTESEKTRLEAQLRQAQKMESVGRLAGGVAHDFNNMLSVIMGNAELALESADSGEPVRAYLQEISAAAARSAGLTRQLLAFARKQAIVPKVLDLDATVEGMLKMLRRLIGEEISLAWLPEPGTWPVRLDPSQVDQVLANLCVNARDAIAGVGTVTIRTSNAVLDEAWCARHAQSVPGEYVMISVTDSGCGMDSHTIDRLFEPFFTTKEEGRGTGLGLATVYGIVRQNNGIIDVSSEPGAGSTFRIYLPRHVGDREAPETERPRGATPGRRETVLLVEDEPAVLGMVKTMLERVGYHVLSTSIPGEAIRLAGEHSGEIHLLITDVIMPEMNGRELSRKLCARSPRLKCLFTSGYTADVITYQEVLDEGVDFLQKPYSMNALAAKVREVLDA